ncbi:exosome complex protein LRP1 [Cryptococcus wingfieldii CBS 7118]|uniref:Exosome complex protein n=1 Tax=Cryptococcus wingfieldii CBS 7118 TaxID=1295528 RepID=A0A1E3K6J1_9TREE|nr:exosome complex protein LRP1 [Cryptococcus wingfieldii CBS 7118]ODO08804.1 exosome complex protein LRP1 [Cryptococcus wingfieldii CBS 7118]
MSEHPPPDQTLTSLTSHLDALEAVLAPLEAKPWSDTTDRLSTLERTKMDVLGAYLINDLIWIYMKMKGIDPAKHEVTAELERIKVYYGKISSAEGKEEARPRIDQAATRRFVSNSLPRAQHLPLTNSAELAARQAAYIAAEQDAENTLRRFGKASRFRHIQDEGSVKLVPGDARDLEDEDVMMASAEQGQQQAEDFLKAFEGEMQA